MKQFLSPKITFFGGIVLAMLFIVSGVLTRGQLKFYGNNETQKNNKKLEVVKIYKDWGAPGRLVQSCKEYKESCVAFENTRAQKDFYTLGEVAILSSDDRDCALKNDCIRWGSPKMEEMNIALNSEQLKTLMNEFQSEGKIMANWEISIKDTRAVFSAANNIPFYMGTMEGELINNSEPAYEGDWFVLSKLNINQEDQKSEQMKKANQALNKLITRTAEKYGIRIKLATFDGDRLLLSGESPDGMFKEYEDKLIFDVNVVRPGRPN